MYPNKTKLSKRAIPGVLLGYEPQQKGYKIYNLKTKSIFIFRDVKFIETMFPFHLTNPTSVTDFCLPLCLADDNIPIYPIITNDHSTTNISSPEPYPLSDNSSSPHPSTPITNTYIPSEPPVLPHTNTDTLPIVSATIDPAAKNQQIVAVPDTTTSSSLRRSTRQTHQPKWLNDFVPTKTKSSNNLLFTVNDSANTNQPYPVSVVFSKPYVAYKAHVFKIHEPCTYKQAIKDVN